MKKNMRKSTKLALVSIAASVLLPGTPVGLILAIEAEGEAAKEDALEFTANMEALRRKVEYDYSKAILNDSEKLEIVPRRKGGQ